MPFLLNELLPTIALLLVLLKLEAAVWGVTNQFFHGGNLAERLRAGGASREELFNLVYASNPLDRILYAGGSARFWWIQIIFRAPFTISLSLLTLLLEDWRGAYHHSLASFSAWLALALGIATAASATVHLGTAVIRRLIFGADDAFAQDIAAPNIELTASWAVTVEEGQNLALYFMGLVYLATAGFAALYAALDAVSTQAFARGDVISSPVNWLYLSVATVSTLGFGDVHARSVPAQLAVIWQIATGPLLLSWLLAVFATPARRKRLRFMDAE